MASAPVHAEDLARLGRRVDIAVGDDWDPGRLLDGADGIVFDRTNEGAFPRAPVDRQRGDAGVFGDAGDAYRITCSRLQPVRILSVTGTSTELTTAAMIAATRGSFCSSADPAATLQTFFAGQPMLMSMIWAPRSTL